MDTTHGIFSAPSDKLVIWKKKGKIKWLRYGPITETKKVFNRNAGLPCVTPQNAFRTSLHSSSQTIWVIYGTEGQPMPTKSKMHSTVFENPIEMFTHRLLGENYKDVFCDENKMCRIVSFRSPGRCAWSGPLPHCLFHCYRSCRSGIHTLAP